jgi:hypothetical protein
VKKLAIICTIGLLAAGCRDDAQVASENLSKAADNFEITRRILFYNGITDKIMLEIVGKCSIDNGKTAKSITATCKVGSGSYVKHQLGLSDNVTFFSEQIGGADVSVDMYRVTWKPSTIIPDIDIRGSFKTNPVPAPQR